MSRACSVWLAVAIAAIGTSAIADQRWTIGERLRAVEPANGVAPPHGLSIGSTFAESLPILSALAETMMVERAVSYETDVGLLRAKAAESGFEHWYDDEIGDRQRFLLARLTTEDRRYTIETRFCAPDDTIGRAGFQLFSIEVWRNGTVGEDGWLPFSLFPAVGNLPRSRVRLDRDGRLVAVGGTGEQDHRGVTPAETPVTYSVRMRVMRDGAFEGWEELVADARRCGTGTGVQPTVAEQPFRLD